MKRKNIYFGFGSARPTRAALVKSRKAFRAGVSAKRKAADREYSRLRRAARGSFPSKKKLEDLFHEVYGQNPKRQFPGDLSAAQIRGLVKLLKAKGLIMSKPKKQRKKKRNSRKGKMPAGLRKYWAKMRAKKNGKRRKKKNSRNVARVRSYRPRMKRVKAIRRRRRNTVRRMPRTVWPPFAMTSTQLKKYSRQLARATGKRVVIKKP